MELWIRSQDRLELIKANDIKIFDCEKQKEKYEKSLLGVITQEPYNRIGFEISSCGNVLGVYNSKERALEVLDEIQRTMSKTLDCIIEQSDNCVVGCNTLVIYEMPID